MIYQGDTYTFILSLTNANGSTPTIGTAPSIQIINAASGTSVLSVPASMNLVTGSTLVYTYSWSIPSATTSGDYFAVVSYSMNGDVYNGQYLDRVRIGDTYVSGPVALNSTVALNATVAKDATVAHITDLQTINPNTSSVVLSIQSKTNNLPNDPVSTALVTNLLSLITDIHDVSLGEILIDKTVNPRVMTIKRVADGSTLAMFYLSETPTLTTRSTQLIPPTNTPNSVIVLSDSATGTAYNVSIANGTFDIEDTGVTGANLVAPILIDIVTGLHYTLEVTSGALTEVPVSNTLIGTPSYALVDTVTGVAYTLSISNGSLRLTE